MKVCIAGKNRIAVEVTDYLLHQSGIIKSDELMVVCNRTESGADGWQPSLRAYAQKNGILEVQLEELYQEKDLIFLSLEYDRIIRPNRFLTKHLYNIHFSLLPKYKGMYTAVMPILHHEKESGVSFHRIDSGIDCGPIWKQIVIPIKEYDTAYTLYMKCMGAGIQLAAQAVKLLLTEPEQMQFYKQDAEEASYYGKDSFDFRNKEINLKQTAVCVRDQVRALHFRAYQMPELFGVPVIDTKVLSFACKEKAGTILTRNRSFALAMTIDRAVTIFYDRFEELMEAISSGDFSTVREICTVKAHIYEQNAKGETPLLRALRCGRYEIAEFLIGMGADVLQRDEIEDNVWERLLTEKRSQLWEN